MSTTLYIAEVQLLVQAQSPEHAERIVWGALENDCAPPGWLVDWGYASQDRSRKYPVHLDVNLREYQAGDFINPRSRPTTEESKQ